MTIRKPAGGDATAGGMDFQHRVTAWVAVRILAEKEVSLPWDLPVTTTLEWLRCETEQPVDDLLVGTADGGLVFSQIKHTLQLSTSANQSIAVTTMPVCIASVSCGSGPRWSSVFVDTDAWAVAY